MEDLHFMRLWDRYSPLLTDTQREITNLYFNFDLSLAEIAEEKGCSRQSVSDCLNKCRKQLEEYEEKLHLVAITEALEAFGEKYPEHRQEVEQISESGK
ncbi:MAG: DNA-binding protein [Clostridia bacterium]|nr:DNA-binding protein [Clostridia bacterium]